MKNLSSSVLRSTALTTLLAAGLTVPVLAQTTGTGAARSPATSATESKVPFDGMDLTWINGQNRQSTFPLVVKDKASPLSGITQAAFSLNNHYGFQTGDGVKRADNYMLASSLANRIWFNKNKMAVTARAGFVTNPSRYLSFNPSAVGFTNTDATKLTAREYTATYDIMPNDFVTFRLEYLHRRANVPYFAGRGGTTSPSGYVDQPLPANWQPDLRDSENRAIVSVNFRL